MAVHKKLLIAEPLPALTSLLNAAGLKLVDIGGRRSSFPELVTLAPFADYYISEPDPAEAAHLSVHLTRDLPWRSVTVIAEAIGSRRGPATLYVTREPGMSSLLEPDPQVTRRFYLGDRFDVVSTTTVPVLPLDEAAERYAFTDACFLKMAALTADVGKCVGRGTRHAKHKAKEQGIDDETLLGASFRDRKHLE